MSSPMSGSDLLIAPPERTAASPSGSAPDVGPVDHVVTSGIFSLDGGTREVDNNVWIVGDEDLVNQAPALSDRFDAPVYLQPGEAPLWAMVHLDRAPDHDLCDGDVHTAGGIELQVITTPGHSPGSTCLYVPELGTVSTGDTLFRGGPGATGRSFSSCDTIIDSIRTRLLTLPGDTAVRTGHGDSISIGAEAPHLDEWIARGH